MVRAERVKEMETPLKRKVKSNSVIPGADPFAAGAALLLTAELSTSLLSAPSEMLYSLEYFWMYMSASTGERDLIIPARSLRNFMP